MRSCRGGRCFDDVCEEVRVEGNENEFGQRALRALHCGLLETAEPQQPFGWLANKIRLDGLGILNLLVVCSGLRLVSSGFSSNRVDWWTENWTRFLFIHGLLHFHSQMDSFPDPDPQDKQQHVVRFLVVLGSSCNMSP